ncbi:GTP pyrophosphokinase [Novosphingobium sp.]|uniref:GTP pyrophosphokinase n=1 Tax=Novosphingobium sp. TaxID=1874826 RepID=UPI002FDA85AB
MTKESDFLDRWAGEKAAHEAWGCLVSTVVQQKLEPLIAPVPVNYFLRVAVSPRVKDDLKLVEKAFYRNKNYGDPYADITDKIGTRFVVLLGSDIRKIEQALTAIPGWTLSKDRDYEEEQKKNPLKFDYAAVHFIVRPTDDTEFEGIPIPADTPCEVQIKTLLQHAYSELTHDTIYKPQIAATHDMQRNAAKAMALLEATNDYFEKVSTDVNAILAAVRRMTADLSAIYCDVIGFEPKPTVLEGMLLGAYETVAGDDHIAALRQFIDDNPFVTDRIKAHVADRNPIFSQPSVLLAYYAVHRSVRRAISAWPLTPREMEPLLNDLGESVN